MSHDTSTIKGKIAVMQSAEAGKPLQKKLRCSDSDWRDVPVTDVWDWLNSDYRIRPALREWAIYQTPDGTACAPWNGTFEGVAIRVREV